MRRLTGLLLLALALTFGTALADQHEGEPADAPATTTDGGTADDAADDTAEGAASEDGETDATDVDAVDTDTTDVDAADTDTVDTDTAETDAAAMESAAVDGELGDEAETEAAFEAFMAEEHAAATQPNEVTEFLAAREDMSIFLMLLAQAGMSETLLEGDRPITIFAPSDSAFAKMDRLQFSTLVDDPDELRRVLERHIATETLSSADLDDRLSAEGAVAGGGAGDMEVAAAPETEAVGGDAEVGAETAADEATEAALLDPNAFVRVSTRAGEDIEIGRLSATDRVAAMTPAADAAAEGTDAADATEVAGGGAADDAGAATAETVRAVPGIIYVGDAQVVESDLSAGDTTIHVVDAVLLPPMPEEEDEAAQ